MAGHDRRIKRSWIGARDGGKRVKRYRVKPGMTAYTSKNFG